MYKIEVKNVTFKYSRGTPFERVALDNVSVGFEEGKITGLIGHTGSGKSTLVNLLNGLYEPHGGEVLLDGVNIWQNRKEISKIRYRVGLVMQYPEYQLFDETVRQDIAFGPRNQGLSTAEIDARVKEVASFTGIDGEMLEKSPFELSGGQKRRVAIAGILAMKPEVLVLDEPAAGLDPRGRKEILGGLCQYVKKEGITLILVSHSMEDMAHYCDNVIVMSDAKVLRVGSVDEVFSEAELLESVGLDVPSVSKIASILRKEGISLKGELYTVEGLKRAIIEFSRRNKI